MRSLLLAIILTFALPVFADAPDNYKELVTEATRLISRTIPVIASLILLTFFWGLVRFIKANTEGNAKRADEGKKLIIWSLLGLFVVMSLVGIISLLSRTFFDNLSDDLPTPTERTFTTS